MAPLLRDSDAVWTLFIIVPLLFAAASWALQMACAFCAVEAPSYWHAFLIVISVAIANVTVRYFLEVTDSVHGIWGNYMSPVLTSGVVIALTAPTPLLSGIGVSVIHFLICGMMYFGGRQVVDFFSSAQLY